MRRLSTRFTLFLASCAQAFLAFIPVQAQYVGSETTPSPRVNVPLAASSISSVKEALTAPDDTHVVLEGFIVNKLRHKHYTFSDATGKIEIKLDDKYLPAGQTIDSKTRVRITGEIDRHFQRPNDIEVKHIEMVQQGAVQ
jgi:uncharacterized protein (TIGR00156 family)